MHERSLGKKARRAKDETLSTVQSLFGNVTTVQAFGQEEQECGRYNAMLAREGALQQDQLSWHKKWTAALQFSINAM
jgi:ABC-type multidrug transport system fused ATPase/permease subunit